MKRLVYIISTFLILVGMYGGSVSAGGVFWNSDQAGETLYKYPARKFSANESQMSDSDKNIYTEWSKNEPISTYDVALAQSPNGWAAGWTYTSISKAKRNALGNCRRHIGPNCKIVDVNRNSAFIKQRGSSGSSSTASSSSSGSATTTTSRPTLTVSSSPSYADVYINNSYRGKTTLTVQGSPGYYSVRVEKDGFNSFQRGVQLKKDVDIWASLTKKEEPKPEPKPEPLPPKLIGTGTGFVIDKDYIVTADHVVDGCNEVTVRHKHKEYWTDVVARDASNDLGLLRLEEPFSDTAKLRGGKAIRLGESISTYGYPLFGELSDSAKITQGNINSLAGIGNDSRTIQFDAPTQPGNSGGPVLDSSGNVVGARMLSVGEILDQMDLTTLAGASSDLQEMLNV